MSLVDLLGISEICLVVLRNRAECSCTGRGWVGGYPAECAVVGVILHSYLLGMLNRQDGISPV